MKKKHVAWMLPMSVIGVVLCVPVIGYVAENEDTMETVMSGAQGSDLNVGNNDIIEKKDIKEEEIGDHETYTVIVTADVLNVRDGQSTMADIVMQIKQDECYPVTGEPVNGWYPIQTEYADGWVCGDYIERVSEINQEGIQAIHEKESYPAVAVNHILTGQQIVDYACQFIGNPYVWGGTSLTEGADCSGFVQSVYEHFGISLPRTTYEMIDSGREVAYEDAVPGDLILYDGHVGIYMGDGNIVNAMNEEDGIGICSAGYTDIITVRRLL